MMIRIRPGAPEGTVERVIASKSQAHRLLICAALAEGTTELLNMPDSEDVTATERCLKALGLKTERKGGGLAVSGGVAAPRETAVMDCGESGSTLRFLLPVAAALGARTSWTGRGRLAQRPLKPLDEQMTAHGISLSPRGIFPLEMAGRLLPGDYVLDGGVSSQYFSGLLMALPLLEGDSTLRVIGRLESRPYVDLTLETLKIFGADIRETEDGFRIPGGQRFLSPGSAEAEGDWSGAAFWLCAGALGGSGITCGGLKLRSAQGDREILRLLRAFGAWVQEDGDRVTVRPGTLHGTEIHAEDIPDLVPVLAAVALHAEGDTVIRGTARLRMKESDRAASVTAMVNSLGGCAENLENTLIIRGGRRITGGEVDCFRDHRIVMAAAVAATRAEGPVILRGAEAVAKSYPGFFGQFAALGGRTEEYGA